MGTLLNQGERKGIADRVRTALQPYQPSAFKINVSDDAISKDDDWYQVLVTTPNHERGREFYDALARAEADLERGESGGVHYLLVPVLG